MTPQEQPDSQAEDETHEKLKMAIMHDFNNLYVPGFTTDWEAQRTVRQLELDVMSLKHTVQAAERLAAKRALETIDRIEQSVKQHTVPEGPDLATKSYIFNTLEFERHRIATLTKKDQV